MLGKKASISSLQDLLDQKCMNQAAVHTVSPAIEGIKMCAAIHVICFDNV